MLNLSFWPSGISTSFTNGLPSRETCWNAPLFTGVPLVWYVRDACRLARAKTPMIDVASVGSVPGAPPEVRSVFGTWMAMVLMFLASSELIPGAAGMCVRKAGLERAKVAQVEDGAQVDVEPLGALAGEHRVVGRQRVDRGVGQRDVVGRRVRSDVAGRAGQAAGRGQDRRHAVDDLGHAVGLALVPVRVGQRADRAGVVEERVRVLQRLWKRNW